jgi:hypothetical protein
MRCVRSWLQCVFAAPIVSLSPGPFKKGEASPFAARFAGNIGPRSNSPDTGWTDQRICRINPCWEGSDMTAVVERLPLEALARDS